MDEGANHPACWSHCAPSPRTTDNGAHGPRSTGSLISRQSKMAEPPSNPRKGNSRPVASAHKVPGYTYPNGNLKWPSSRVEPNRRPAQVGMTRTNRRRTPQERATNEPGAELFYTRGSSWTRRGDGHAETPPIARGRAGEPGSSSRIGQ